MAPRFKTEFWLSAYRKRLEAAQIPYYIVKKGHDSAGAIFLNFDDKILMSPEYQWELDRYQWVEIAYDENISQFMDRQARFDPDFWQVDIGMEGKALLFDEGL